MSKPPVPALASRASGQRLDPERDRAILAATVALLEEVGFQAVSVDAIVRQARASKATVYRRWPSKSALVVEAICQAVEDGRPAPDTGSFVDDSRALLRDLVRVLRTRGRRLLPGLVAAIAQSPELGAQFHRRFTGRRCEAGRVIFQRAIARGEVRPDVDGAIVGQAAAAVIVERALFYPEDALDDDLADRVLEELLLPACRRL